MEAPQSESAETVLNATEATISAPMEDDDNQASDQFECQEIDAALLSRIEHLTSRQPHRFLRRGIFFAHSDLHQILDSYETGEKFYLYTGTGLSSESLHLGHLIPFMFTKYLQSAFKVPVVIQLTDESKQLARENAKDIIACGFDIERTYIFQDNISIGGKFYENMMDVSKQVTFDDLEAIFGFSGEDNITTCFLPVVQAAPSFASSFPYLFGDHSKLRCLIPCAIGQDPYFRMTRDVAPKLGYHKPSLIESKNLPCLQGGSGKMSASDPNTAIYLTDKPGVIKKKIRKYAFSGGQDTVELHTKYGANIDVDVSIKYLSFFLEDDARFQQLKEAYKAGHVLTGEVKDIVVDEISKMASIHQRARALLSEEVVDMFMCKRSLLV